MHRSAKRRIVSLGHYLKRLSLMRSLLLLISLAHPRIRMRGWRCVDVVLPNAALAVLLCAGGTFMTRCARRYPFAIDLITSEYVPHHGARAPGVPQRGGSPVSTAR